MEGEEEKIQVSSDDFTRLNQRFIEFREKGYFIDCVIKCADKLIKCHRLILSSLSSYFKDKFSSFIGPTETTVVDIPSEFSQKIEEIIDFFYTKTISIDESSVICVLAFGIRFQTPILQQIAEEQLTFSHFAKKETVLNLSKQMNDFSIGSFPCHIIIQILIQYFDEFDMKTLIQSISATTLFSILNSPNFTTKRVKSDSPDELIDFRLSLIDNFHLITPIENEEDKENLSSLFDNFQSEDAYLYVVHHKLNWAPYKMTFPLYKKALALKRESAKHFRETLSNVDQTTSRWLSVHWLSTILNAKDSYNNESYDAIEFCRSFGGKIQNANPLSFGFLHSDCSTPLGLEDNSSFPKKYVSIYGPEGALMHNDQYFTSINAGAFLMISFGEKALFKIKRIEIESVPKGVGDKKMAKKPNKSIKIDRGKRLGYPESLKISLNTPNSLDLKQLSIDNITYNFDQNNDQAEYIVNENESDDFVANNLKITLSSKNKAGGIILRIGTVRVDGCFI